MLAPSQLQTTAQKTSKVSFTWAKLIARIYEVNPLLCSCGKNMKIIKIVTDPTQIWRILTKIGWSTTAPDFDEPQDLIEWNICQLVTGSADGFPEEYDPPHISGPDPPDCHFADNIDPPHWEENNIDLPHWEDSFIQYD
jgi:hypothetical protein